MYKNILLLMLVAVAMVSCGTGKTAVTSSPKTTGAQKDIIDYGMKYLNKPYRYAAKGPNAFDCSGFTSFVFREFGYKLSPSSAGQDKQVPAIRRKEDLQVGDLVFFEGRRQNGNVGHVGIVKEVLGKGEFMFLHASTGYGVIVSRSTEPYYASRYLRGGRVLPVNSQLVAAKNVSKEKPKSAKTDDRRKNAFTPARAKEQVLTDAPKTQTEKEVELAMAQNPNTPELQENKSDSLIIHTRPIDAPLPDSTQNKQNKDEIHEFTAQSMVRTDSVSIPKPVEIKIMTNDSTFHDVKPGETLYSISKKYNCTVEELRTWNPTMSGVIKAGDKLVVRK